MGKLTFIIVFIGGIIAALLKFKDKLFNMKAEEKLTSVNEIKKDVVQKTEEIKVVEAEAKKAETSIADTIEKSNKETKETLKNDNVDSLLKELDKW